MKKIITLILLVCITTLSFCGCGASTSSLTVYVVESDALYREAVIAFRKENPEVKLQVVSFESYNDMKEQMSTELMSGKGPDVLLLNGFYNTGDTFKMSASGNLLKLDERVSSLEDGAYFTTVLEAGKTNGHQYYLPFSWNIVQAYSSQDTIAAKGYTDDLYDAYTEESIALANDQNMAVSSMQIGRSGGRADMLNYFFEVAGVELIDRENGELNDVKEAVKKTAEFVKVLNDNMEKTREVSKRYANDFAGAVAHFTYLMEDFSFMNNLRYYQTVYPKSVNEEMYFAPFKNSSGGITAQVVEYGAINANTKNEEQAWELLCFILDFTGNMNFSKYDEKSVYYAPVNKTSYAAYVDELATQDAPGPGEKVSSLAEEWGQVLEELPSKVNRASLPKISIGEMVQECMNPYLTGADSFDSCYETLMKRLQTYLAE
ncbi:MAG: carbohydrate ABC transporter substrate-binding protein [Lachnospiraceae bacterium]|nr:carbohydrate ABC transporter substrate-binding protein [Lachnospiraceae bacterium]